ncbi:hypothetical protein [Paludibacterium purpuratum]|uniref:Uncharacterized protein n=1 Tax=Paludibacterium purpuratum TaxID=1144873 RepID=A0A4R7BCU8_9NEIS|nr:hypothetical protein [Paludibacterium purpuratum]TDR82778.1 hypothetical protein DFP86_101167 [Paludibacterium purpuratum]
MSMQPLPADGAPTGAHIARLEGDPEYGFADLRRRGLALAQAGSGELWSDYNHHDPGVTLLEALCYALTEGLYGADMALADLLTGENGRIDYARHGLHPPEDALPCRPCTESDWLRYLFDRVPQLRHARLSVPQDDGRWHWALNIAETRREVAAVQAMRAYWRARNLGEDLAVPPVVLKPRWCALQFELSVEGPRDVTDILVELVRRTAERVGAVPQRQSMRVRLDQAMREGGLDSASLFEGPALRDGWLDAEALSREMGSPLYFSDLAQTLRQIDGVADVLSLRLIPCEGEAQGNSLERQGDDWALQLHWPEAAGDLSQWQVRRRGIALAIDTGAVIRRLHDERKALGLAAGWSVPDEVVSHWLSLPAGRYLAPMPYLSSWHHLPPLYRAAHAAPAADAAGEGQFAAYLALLEQWLAHGEAQQQHLRQLFSVDAAPGQSYWWDPLDADRLPGLAGLRDDDVEAFAEADAALARRGRVLDLLLALHGESCGQNSLQNFGWYYRPAQWQLHLYECKRRLLTDVVRQTRDRGGAFDYSRPALDTADNTAPLHTRIALLLGFSHSHSRRLCRRLADMGMAVAENRRLAPAAGAPAGQQALAMWPPSRAGIDTLYAEDLVAGRVADRLAHYFTELDPSALPAALLRAAAHAERYRVVDDPGRPLWLGPDENNRWWPLTVRGGPAHARAAGRYLHAFACDSQRDAEGLHLVEHVLLRPCSAEAAADVPDDFYPHRISLVFAGWTARGRDPGFRELAKETVEQSCPAHVLPRLFWLDAAPLAAFEQAFAAWLDARRAYCQALRDDPWQVPPSVVGELDRTAGQLRGSIVDMGREEGV